MAENKILGLVNKHVENNFWLYTVSLLCVCTGIVLGMYSVRYMGGFEKGDLLSYLKNFNSAVNSGGVNYKHIFLEALKSNMSIILAVWFLGLTMIGIPIILIVDIAKGFTIGFTASFAISSIGVKGIWFSILGLLPQNIIYIPCVIFASVLAMEFSLNIFKEKNSRLGKSGIWLRVTSYSLSFIFVIAVMFIGFFMEAYITPNVIKYLVASL